MSLAHYFLEEQILAQQEQECFTLLLSADDAKHARVARLGKGEHIAVIDAAQDYFECEVVSFDGALPQVRIARKLEGHTPRANITLIQGLAKGEKMELVIRHATELGVNAFVPLKCERSIVKLDEKKAADRVKRWSAIAKSAAMQSGQRTVASVASPQTLRQFMQSAAQFDALFVCWEEAPTSQRLSLALDAFRQTCSKPLSSCSIGIVVGPEGGLSDAEVQTLLACDRACLVSLGTSILRTETAGIVAPALVLYELGELGGRLNDGGADAELSCC